MEDAFLDELDERGRASAAVVVNLDADTRKRLQDDFSRILEHLRK